MFVAAEDAVGVEADGDAAWVRVGVGVGDSGDAG